MSILRSRAGYALLLLPVLLGAKGGGKGCACDRKGDTDVIEVVNTDLPTPEDPLQVVSVDPSSGTPMVAQKGTVYGSGFAEGATVQVGANAVKARRIDGNSLAVELPALPEGSYAVVVTNPDGMDATLRKGYRVAGVAVTDCRTVIVPFDFDKAELSDAAKRAVDARRSCFDSATRLVVSGHADERGTTEYNLALGERRADAVARYLSSTGVYPSKVRTTSYGEEKPLARGHDEAAWAQNRRVEIEVMP